MGSNQTKASLTRQFAWASVMLAVMAVAFIAAGSWWWIDRLTHDSSRTLAQRDVELRAAQVSATLKGIDERLYEVVGSPLVSPARTGGQGRDDDLLPYLGNVKSINGMSMELLLVDFEGNEMARNGDSSVNEAQRAWLLGQLKRGVDGAIVMKDGDTDVMLMLEMATFPRTNTVEGALLAKFPLNQLQSEPSFALVFGAPAAVGAETESRSVQARVAMPVNLEPLRLDLVQVGAPLAGLESKSHPVVLLVVAALLMASVVWVGARLVHRLTTDLRSLDRFTRGVTDSSDSSAPAPEPGAGEVASLASSVNRMLDHLTQQHEALQSESQTQIRLLATCISRLNDIVLITEAEPVHGVGPRILFVNDAFVRRTGYSREEAIGQTPRILQGPKTCRVELDRIGASLRGWQPVRAELLNYTKSGEEFWIELDIVPVADDKGWFTHWVAIERDVTDRKHAEEIQRGLELQVREAQKMEAIGTLAGGIAHDFNNILGAILGNVALARAELEPGHRVHARLEQIHRSSDRARMLVQQILTFSRRQPQQFATRELQGLVEETVALLRATVPVRVKLVTELPEAPIFVLADSVALVQVLMNLGTNAWHALRGSAGTVTFGASTLRVSNAADLSQLSSAALAESMAGPATGSATVPETLTGTEFRAGLGSEAGQADDGSAAGQDRLGLVGLVGDEYAHFWVRDTGIGMDAATQARAFEPFFTTKPVGSGTGLGLSVVHGIVQSHGGVITIESELGLGTTFHVFLPRAAPPLALPEPAALSPEPPRGQGQHVLYVDDDEVMLMMSEALLQQWGYRVTPVRSAQAAIDAVMADDAAFDVLVTDFNMPDLSGLEVLRAVSRIRPDLPLILTSGYLSDDVRAEALAEGARGLLHKENLHDELAGLIATVLPPAAGKAQGPALPAQKITEV